MNSNGGDGNFWAEDDFLGENSEKLAELGRDWTSNIERLFYLYDLATFRFFYFDLQYITLIRLIRMALSNF